jgi:hypothetical protein
VADANIELKLNDVRLSFFNGFTPQDGKDDDGNVTRMNYNTNVLIPKDSPLVDMIKKAMGDAKKAKWGDSPPRLAPDKLCLRDGEPKDDTDVPVALYDGYAGHFYLSANKPVSVEDYEAIKAGRKKRPISIIGPRKGPDGKFKQLVDGDEFAPYSGCFANVIVRIYGYIGDAKKNRPARINASLEAVQYKRFGEPFGSRGIDVDNAFDEEDDEAMDGSDTSSGASGDDFNIG